MLGGLEIGVRCSAWSREVLEGWLCQGILGQRSLVENVSNFSVASVLPLLLTPMSSSNNHSSSLSHLCPAPSSIPHNAWSPMVFPKIPCECTIWSAGPLVGMISHNNTLSYAGPRQGPYVGECYPREGTILDMATVEGMDNAPLLDNLYLPDMIFVNAIAGYCRVSAPLSAEFPALQAHITHGLLDISTDNLPMITPPEQHQYRYAAAGDAMLLEYCNTLNQEVSRAVRF